MKKTYASGIVSRRCPVLGVEMGALQYPHTFITQLTRDTDGCVFSSEANCQFCSHCPHYRCQLASSDGHFIMVGIVGVMCFLLHWAGNCFLYESGKRTSVHAADMTLTIKQFFTADQMYCVCICKFLSYITYIIYSVYGCWWLEFIPTRTRY